MKKVYTMLNRQDIGLCYYGDEKNQLFEGMKVKVHYPVIAYLSTILEKDEKFTILVVGSFDSEKSEEYFSLIKEELDQYYANRYILKRVHVTLAYDQKGQISTFKKLYETFEENDEIYFDVTFGLRPTPMTVFVSCNYAQKFVKNVRVCNMVYAYYNFNADEDYVHPIIDITSLFLLNNLINTLSEVNSNNPMRFLENVFKFDEE